MVLQALGCRHLYRIELAPFVDADVADAMLPPQIGNRRRRRPHASPRSASVNPLRARAAGTLLLFVVGKAATRWDSVEWSVQALRRSQPLGGRTPRQIIRTRPSPRPETGVSWDGDGVLTPPPSIGIWFHQPTFGEGRQPSFWPARPSHACFLAGEQHAPPRPSSETIGLMA